MFRCALSTALLLVLCQPAQAARTKPAEVMLASESSLKVASSALETLSSELDMDKMTDEDTWCNVFSRQKLKTYYFEIMTPGGERTSMKLTRDPVSPKLLIANNQAWSVTYDESKDKVDWELLGPENVTLPAEDTVEIDLVRDVALIRRFKETDENGTALPDMIEILYRDGRNFSFIGGAYYPKRLMKKAFVQGVRLNDSATEIDLHAVQEVTVKGVATSISKSALLGGVLGSVLLTANVGAIVGPQYMQEMKELAQWFPGAENIVRYGSILAAMFAIGVLVVGVVLSVGFVGVGLALALEGAAAGIVASLPVAVLKVLVTSFLAIRKKHTELAMDASEKLFSKLRCHRAFKECGEEGDVLVPKELDCPSSQ